MSAVTGRPDPLRIRDYLAGGKDNYHADRQFAERLLDPVEGYPGLRRVAAAHWEFITGRTGNGGCRRPGAAEWLAGQGIRQFVVPAATFLPDPSLSLAAAAGRHQPSPAVALVATDPVVLAHVAALEAGAGTAAVRGDLRDPAAVLASPELRAVIDLSEPVCVSFASSLSLLPAAEAAEAVAGWTGPLAPGSAAAVSCAHFTDRGLGERITALYAECAPWHDHGPDLIGDWFAGAGLELVPPGIVAVENWHGGWRDVPTTPRGPVQVFGGVGIKKQPPSSTAGRGLPGMTWQDKACRVKA